MKNSSSWYAFMMGEEQEEETKGVIQKTKTGKIASKKHNRGGGGGQRCQKDTTVPTKSDFNAISTKNSRISTILWQKKGGGPMVLYFLDAIFPVLVF